DTLGKVSNIATLYSHKIDKENSKNGIRKSLKQYDCCGFYVNRIVNDGDEMIKTDDNDISDEEISDKEKKSVTEEFLLQMLERFNCNSLPCPCRQVTLSRYVFNYKQAFYRFLQDDSKSKENSVIFVPKLEVYKFCELQNMRMISGNKEDKAILHDDGEPLNDVMLSNELILQDESGEVNDGEEHLLPSANAVEYSENFEQKGKKMMYNASKFYSTLSKNEYLFLQEQSKINAEFAAAAAAAAKKLADNKLALKISDSEIKQCDGQRIDFVKSENFEWQARDVEKDSDNSDKTVDKSLNKWYILSSFRKKNPRAKLLHLNSSDSKNSFFMKRTSAIFRRPLNRGSYLSGRQCSRTQRMEKRATKTLGIVVGTVASILHIINSHSIEIGIFLACWVPFFSVYILNAVCIQMDIKSCQVDFYAFFYTTWLGYINSCVNPIIYTVFNVEFRRAFKCILFGKVRSSIISSLPMPFFAYNFIISSV
uniref:G_PROTEIN_RECEP_F1_2 domain-containing protein n=1 Tax=Elaeophora elaphi TaxID=1147741 RepID=A0A0R3RSU5_9BILA